MSIDAGTTIPGKTNWIAYGKNGIYVDIDTSGAGFHGTPLYFPSIGGTGNQWATSGSNAVYNSSPTGFRVYIRWLDGAPLTPEFANQREWHIQWHAVSGHMIHEAEAKDD